MMMDRIAGSEVETRLANFKSSGQQDNTQRGTFSPFSCECSLHLQNSLSSVLRQGARESCLFPPPPFLAARETDKRAIQTAGVTLPVQLQPDSGTVDTVLGNTEEFEKLNAD